MKKIFTAIIDELYGAKKAGYVFAPGSVREYDKDLALRAGERLTDNLLDAFYDFDSGVYTDENGDPYAVTFWAGKPFCWQRLVKMERRVSVDNGATYCTPSEALAAVTLDQLANYMDDDTREAVHAELAPCSDLDFLTRYLQLAPDDLILG